MNKHVAQLLFFYMSLFIIFSMNDYLYIIKNGCLNCTISTYGYSWESWNKKHLIFM